MTEAIEVPSPVNMVCSHCGSDEIKVDAFAVWVRENQMWELDSTFGATYCNQCDGESSYREAPCE